MKQNRLKFQTPPGLRDILPKEQAFFEKVFSLSDRCAKFYNFERIDTPILEDCQLFIKSTGEHTEIVEKQMYLLKTKGGEYLALRPEFTPGLARAYFEQGMISWPHPVKLYARGPVFRYEKPQAGRYRQFHQINLEIFGSKDAIADVEIIWVFYNLLKNLGIKDLMVAINSIGDSQCRPYFKKSLIKHLRSNEKNLCPDCKRRTKSNPLRVLDCKEIKCQTTINQAPQILDYLCKECADHFKEVLESLDALEIPYSLNPYLVRGLDYYTKTVFEIIIPQKDDQSRQNALVGGGRYDDLLKLIGKRNVRAAGAAGGVERIINAMQNEGVVPESFFVSRVFIAQLGNRAKVEALKLSESFKKLNIQAISSLAKDSLTAQLKIANKMKMTHAIIIGEEEVLKNQVILRDMISGNQEIVPQNLIVQRIKSVLGKSRQKV